MSAVPAVSGHLEAAMRRREFLEVASVGAAAPQVQIPPSGGTQTGAVPGAVTIERPAPGRPHAGKVLLAIQPHADDIPLFAAGTVAKLIDEGYTAYLVRVTNDDMAGPGSVGETVLANEKDNNEVARVLGFKQSFDLNYNNHWMDGISKPELRLRFIYLIRLLKVDTVVCYDPWGHYEENPDHYVTAQCVEAACWMAGGSKDYPEHFAAGLAPHGVRDKYYFARGPQLVNRIVDIGRTIDRKVEVNLANVAQGPAGRNGERLRAHLAAEHLRLPILGDDDSTANRQYVKEFVLRSNRELGVKHGLEYAEAFHYVGPNDLGIGYTREELERYIKERAVPLK
jgi:LmbE family N-acetylglucosaminyl deacetylase